MERVISKKKVSPKGNSKHMLAGRNTCCHVILKNIGHIFIEVPEKINELPRAVGSRKLVLLAKSFGYSVTLLKLQE